MSKDLAPDVQANISADQASPLEEVSLEHPRQSLKSDRSQQQDTELAQSSINSANVERKVTPKRRRELQLDHRRSTAQKLTHARSQKVDPDTKQEKGGTSPKLAVEPDVELYNETALDKLITMIANAMKWLEALVLPSKKDQETDEELEEDEAVKIVAPEEELEEELEDPLESRVKTWGDKKKKRKPVRYNQSNSHQIAADKTEK